jgi:Holliday junction resolvase-like predicted endonuclease
MATPAVVTPEGAARSIAGARGRSRGRSRELAVAEHYRRHGYVAYRLAWGHADIIAMRLIAGTEVAVFELVQVKATAGGPYERFGPADRRALLAEAQAVGAHAVLAWWPLRKQLRLIPSSEWPS